MEIGIKLYHDYDKRPVYRKIFEGVDTLLYLKEIGFTAIEIPIQPNANLEDIVNTAVKFSDMGFLISVHPYANNMNFSQLFFNKRSDNVCYKYFAKLLDSISFIGSIQGEVTCVLHGGILNTIGNRPSFLRNSVNFFDWVQTRCTAHVRVVLEIQEQSGSVIRIADNYEELLHIQAKSGVDLCFDMGHAYKNYLKETDDMRPPAELVKRVKHIHCHDMVGNRDHFPLLQYGGIPWSGYTELFVDNNFDRTIIIEVSPENILEAGGRETLKKSVENLKEILNVGTK